MAQLTLTLDLTPTNILVLSEMLPRLETSIPYTAEMTTAGTAPLAKSDTSAEKNTAPATSTKKVEKPKATPAVEEKAASDTSAAPTKTDVRAVALKLSKAGQQDKLKEIFGKYGADKLSGIAEADYSALMKDLEEAANE